MMLLRELYPLMVNCGAVPTVRAPAPVPQVVATTARDRHARQILSMFPCLFVVLPIPTGRIDRHRRRPAVAVPADRDRVRPRISPKHLCDSQRSGEYQTTLRILRADCRCTFP